MSLANVAGGLLKPQTSLQQLLEDINFQRTKEMRQMLKDDGGFVVLQGTTYWTDLFVRHFLFQTEPVHSIDSDDLLFFVRKKHVKSSSRHMPKYETEVDVFRKDSRKLPIGDPDVDWEETVYLNMVIHKFDYTLTLAICTRTSPKELQVLRRHSQRVYASPSRRKMDTKGEGEEITYPHICFMVDNFDEVFSDILVRDGEMVCVELVANDKDGAVQGVIFLGSIRYDALKQVYDGRQSSLSSKVAQRMSFGLFSSGASVQTRCEFVRMKGPQGKGHAEMAVTKPKGSGVETPTSEPGFCATDMWDDWEDENEDYCSYRHQRRLSDPSSNLHNFARYSWRTKNTTDTVTVSGTAGTNSKARSENEGLDSIANEVSEIEAGDLRDDQLSAFSASAAKLHTGAACVLAQNDAHADDDIKNVATTAVVTPINEAVEVKAKSTEAVILNLTDDNSEKSKTGCGSCFGNNKKSWIAGNDKGTPCQMSEVYCPTCNSEEDVSNATAACLNKMPENKKKLPAKHKSILSVESELVLSSGSAAARRTNLNVKDKKPINRSASLSAADRLRGKLRLEAAAAQRKEKQLLLQREKDKEREKDKLKIKSKPKESKDKEKISKTSNLLAKVSPKRMRKKLTNITTTPPPTITKITNKAKNRTENDSGSSNNKKCIELSTFKNNKLCVKSKKNNEKILTQEYEIADDATSLNGDDYTAVNENVKTNNAKMILISDKDKQIMISVHGREELPVPQAQPKTDKSIKTMTIKTTTTIATTTANSTEIVIKNDKSSEQFKKCVPVEAVNRPLITTHIKANEEEKEEESKAENLNDNDATNNNNNNNNADNDHDIDDFEVITKEITPMLSDYVDANKNNNIKNDNWTQVEGIEKIKTLPRTSKPRANMSPQAYYNRALDLVPKRRTRDGTDIYYWCDLPKKMLKELDDGAYNPLWASRGFTQTFHFWKEHRRAQCVPLNAFLTYVTLPWWSIAKDLLDHRETPILTF